MLHEKLSEPVRKRMHELLSHPYSGSSSPLISQPGLRNVNSVGVMAYVLGLRERPEIISDHDMKRLLKIHFRPSDIVLESLVIFNNPSSRVVHAALVTDSRGTIFHKDPVEGIYEETCIENVLAYLHASKDSPVTPEFYVLNGSTRT